MTITAEPALVRRRVREPRTESAAAVRAAELSAMLADPAYAGWVEELAAARAELLELTATNILGA